MRIYLDTNVFRYLKQPDHIEELALVQSVMDDTIFCFSEAHMYDLGQDRTERKWEDLSFMELIVKDHCFMVDERLLFTHYIPTHLYEDFTWDAVLSSSEDGFNKEIIDNIKVGAEKFFHLIQAGLKEDQPSPEEMNNIPTTFRALLDAADNYDDFVGKYVLFIEDQIKKKGGFKAFLRYLHDNVDQKALIKLKIEGHDGKKITDTQKFMSSYSAHFIKDGANQLFYELFTDMYVNFELFGFFKGKPKKQAFIALQNDARHAYFGAMCDIVVSGDYDFIYKTNNLYSLLNIRTKIIHFTALTEMIKDIKRNNERSIFDLIPLLNRKRWNDTDFISLRNEQGSVDFMAVDLLYSYFDTLAFAENEYGGYYNLIKENNNLYNFPLWTEIVRLKNRLYAALGPDIDGRTVAIHEVPKGDVVLASWLFTDFWVEFKFLTNQLFVVFNPKAYFDNCVKEWQANKDRPEESHDEGH